MCVVHICVMTLDQYLAAKRLTETAFAGMVGANQATINRLKRGSVPGAALMARIIEVTNGEVTPNDFYGIPAAA